MYFVETSNIVLDHMIVVHLCVGFTVWFPKIWLFPYPYGFCNPVQINGKNINAMLCKKNCKGMLWRKALRFLHFSYVHSVKLCGIIVWGNTHNGIKILRKQNNKNYNSRKIYSCRELFKTWRFYLAILSIHFHVYCMWWPKNIYLQRNDKSITITLDLLIIFIWPLLIWTNTLYKN